jgi:hypothetical protein
MKTSHRNGSTVTIVRENDMTEDELNWLHSLFQEMESQGVELPMGDYLYVYTILENARDGEEEV